MAGSAGRGRTLAAGVVAVLLAVASAALALGDELSRKDPQAAVRLGLRTSSALTAAADQRLVADGSGPGAEAKSDAAAALAADPLDVRAVRTLALAAEQEGDTARADTLMRQADARSRRDILTELWLFQADALYHDFAGAARHADAAMRFEWRANSVVFPALTAMLVNPASAMPIAGRLAEKPDWRRWFLPYAANHTDNPGDAVRLFEALAATSGPPTDAEGGAIVERVASTGDFAAARDVWRRLLPAGARAPTGGLYNGDFTSLPGAPPFNWLFPADNGAAAEEGPATDGQPALYVRSPADGQRLLAVELLTLPPGAWRLTGRVRVEPGEAGPVFAWRVGCLNGGDLAEARLAVDPPGWRAFATDFSVPAGCVAQRLQLFGLPHAGFEPAEAYWRGLSVQKLATTAGGDQGAAASASTPRQASSAD
jgi:hypothetical protein